MLICAFTGTLRAGISAAEYYIGSDPGVGAGLPISIRDANDLGAALDPFVIGATHGPGTHEIGIRVRDTEGRWSNALIRRITIVPGDYPLAGGLDRDGPADQGMSDPTATSGFGAGVAAEWFIGTDPGAGNGTALTIDEHGALSAGIATEVLSITHLEPGTHELGLRVRDGQGRWSTAVYRRFTIHDASLIQSTEAALASAGSTVSEPSVHQSWRVKLNRSCLDSDYQITIGGRSVVLSSRSGESLRALLYRLKAAIEADPWLAQQVNVEVMNRSTLEISAKVAGIMESSWITASDEFVVSLSASGRLGTNERKIEAAEWFMDLDPGEGQGSAMPLTLEASGHSARFDPASIDVSMLRAGAHRIGVRFRNAAGRWSAPVYRGMQSFALFDEPDTIAPTITLTGGNTIETTFGEPFVDPGFIAVDETDGDLTSRVSVSGAVNIAVPGDYRLVYAVADLAGNINRIERLVRVVDANDPVISGQTEITHLRPPASIDIFADLVAEDAEQGWLSHAIRHISGEVDWFHSGRYDLVFEVTDSSGNTGTFTRSITLTEDALFYPDYDSWIHGQPLSPAMAAYRLLENADADGDGYSNRHEWLSDTNPFDSDSYLSLRMSRESGMLRFGWCGRKRIRYWLEAAPDLSHWQSLTEKLDVDVVPDLEIEVPLTPQSPISRFFRLGSEPRQPIFVPPAAP